MKPRSKSAARAAAAAALLSLSLDAGANVVRGGLCEFDGGSEGCGAIGDFVWNDLDGNGIQDAGEPGVDNVTVTLYQDNIFYLTAITSGGGSYGFTNVPDGRATTVYAYYLEFSNLPLGFGFSPKDQGGDDSLDSDVNPATGRTDTFQLNFGGTDNEIAMNTFDAGIRTVPQPGSIALLGLGAMGLFAALRRRKPPA